jgi:pimeloyl-ACP methyl ester carboxylesterase
MLASPLFQVPDASRTLVRSMVTENDRLWTVPRELMKGPARPAAERLDEVRAATLGLVGERDLAPQREQADVLGRRLSGARLMVVAGGGHMLNLTSAAAFRDAGWEFLRSLMRNVEGDSFPSGVTSSPQGHCAFTNATPPACGTGCCDPVGVRWPVL